MKPIPTTTAAAIRRMTHSGKPPPSLWVGSETALISISPPVMGRAQVRVLPSCARCFCHLYFPSQDRANKYLRHEQLTAKSTGDVDRSQTKVILGALREFGKIRDTAMSTDYLRSKAWPKGAAEVTTAEVGAEFWKDHGAQFVLDATLLKDAIRDGVRNRVLGLLQHRGTTRLQREGPATLRQVRGRLRALHL